MSRQAASRWSRLALPLQVVFYAAVVGFLLRSLIAGWQQVQDFPWRVSLGVVLGSLASLLIHFLVQALFWAWTVRKLGVPLPYRRGLHLFLSAQMAKYLPGRVWPFAKIAVAGERYGYPGAVLVLMLVLNSALTIWASALFALPVLPRLTGGTGWVLPGTMTLLAATFAASPWVVRWILDATARIRGLKLPPLHTGLLRPTRILLLFVASLVFQTLALAAFPIFLSAFAELSPGDAVYAASAWSAAWLVGFLVVFTPAGAGVREAALVLLLRPFAAQPIGVAVAIGYRVLVTLSDLLLLALLPLLARWAREGEAELGMPDGRVP